MFKFSNGRDEARRRPRAAVVAGGDPRRGKGIGGYQRAHRVLPQRWVVVLVAGEHHVDGGLNSGGRWFGRGCSSSERAAKDKLMLALAYWVLEGVTNGVWVPETASPERIMVEAEAGRGGRSWGRRPPRGPPSGLAGCW